MCNKRGELLLGSESKTVGGRLTQELILCFLAAPHSSRRALTKSFAVVAGVDRNTVSRPSIGAIKDAWAEMYIAMTLRVARSLVATHLQASSVQKQRFAAVHLMHVQDEADLRLRSGDPRDGPALPRRGRASKVQQHVVTLVAGHRRQEIVTDMEALGDKTAKTLRTSLERVVRMVCGNLHLCDRKQELWFAHHLIGDGIATNGAAAKLLWACVQSQPLGFQIRYFLLVVRCATHQAALSAKSGIIGIVASAFGSLLHETITGVAVRLFKYVINEYDEEFCSQVHTWVSADLEVVGPDDADDVGRFQVTA